MIKRALPPDGGLRLGLALKLLETAAEQDIDVLYRWWRDQLETAPALADSSLIVDAAVTQMTVEVSGPTSPFAVRALAHLAEVDAVDAERTRLSSVLQSFCPGRIGSWLSVSHHGIDAGWHADGDASLELIAGIVDPTPELKAARQWAERHGSITVSGIRRSVAEPSPSSELVLTLPNVGLDGQVGMLQALHEALGITWMGRKVVPLLLEDRPAEIEVVIAFTRNGVSRLGMRIPAPTRRLVLLLAGLANDTAHQKLARLEGVLGLEGPAHLSFSRYARNWATETHLSFFVTIGSFSRLGWLERHEPRLGSVDGRPYWESAFGSGLLGYTWPR